LPGQKVALDPPTGWLGSAGSRFTASDELGYYRFEDVVPGSHVIAAQRPARWWPTTASRLKVPSSFHETQWVDFGFYRPQASLYLPLVWAGWRIK